MATGNRDDLRSSDPIEAMLADWLSGVIAAAHGGCDVDSPERYAQAITAAQQARLDGERCAHELVDRLYRGLAHRAALRDAARDLDVPRRLAPTARVRSATRASL